MKTRMKPPLQNFQVLLLLAFSIQCFAGKPSYAAGEKDINIGKPRCEISREGDPPYSYEIKFFGKNSKLIKRLQFMDVDCTAGERSKVVYETLGCLGGANAAVLSRNGTCSEEVVEDDLSGGMSMPTLDFYSAGGKKEWSKLLENCCYANGQVKLSRNGRRIWYWRKNADGLEAVAIDEKGRENKFPFSVKRAPNGEGVSPRGRYGWIRAPSGIKAGERKYVFFDIEKGSIHEFEGAGEGAISDDGKVEVFVSWVENQNQIKRKLVHQYQFP